MLTSSYYLDCNLNFHQAPGRYQEVGYSMSLQPTPAERSWLEIVFQVLSRLGPHHVAETIHQASFNHEKVSAMPFSKHRPAGPMLSISQNVQMFVCLSVCVFTFEVPFKRLFAPTC